MKRLYIVVEGQTEEEFVKSMIAPYLQQYGIFSVTPVILHTSAAGKGGFVNYQHLRNKVKSLLKSMDNDAIISMMVDYFRCPSLPNQEEWDNIEIHAERIEAMERSISDDIKDHRFIPYIQLHEFEALLFSSPAGFEAYFSDEEAQKALTVINSFENPEDINTSPSGAPSKRLLGIREKYEKVVEGNIIALEIGMDSILARCPRFKAWIDKLVEVCK